MNLTNGTQYTHIDNKIMAIVHIKKVVILISYVSINSSKSLLNNSHKCILYKDINVSSVLISVSRYYCIS